MADVVTEVNYLTNQNPQPFIFEAADVNSDNAVNILDVVGTVNIIMTPEAGTSSVDNTATFTVEDGILYVDATTPLGGVQVSVAAPSGTEFETMDSEMSVSSMSELLKPFRFVCVAVRRATLYSTAKPRSSSEIALI